VGKTQSPERNKFGSNLSSAINNLSFSGRCFIIYKMKLPLFKQSSWKIKYEITYIKSWLLCRISINIYSIKFLPSSRTFFSILIHWLVMVIVIRFHSKLNEKTFIECQTFELVFRMQRCPLYKWCCQGSRNSQGDEHITNITKQHG
jgi:hypothetical protein